MIFNFDSKGKRKRKDWYISPCLFCKSDNTKFLKVEKETYATLNHKEYPFLSLFSREDFWVYTGVHVMKCNDCGRFFLAFVLDQKGNVYKVLKIELSDEELLSIILWREFIGFNHSKKESY